MTLETAKDLMSTAIESGIAYWVNEECSKVSVIRKGEGDNWYYARVNFTYGGKKYNVTLAGMREMADKFSTRYPHLPITSMDHDSISADAFFQYCAFQDIVFG